MKLSKKLKWIGITAAPVAAVSVAFGFTVSPKVGILTGHEEITRQSILWAQDILTEDFGMKTELFQLASADMTDLETQLFGGIVGHKASNPIIRGNYAMDNPEQSKYGWEVALAEFFQVSVDSWHTDKKTQPLHALRKYVGENMLESAKDACNATRGTIIDLSAQGLKKWRELVQARREDVRTGRTSVVLTESLRRQALFYLGSATHVIQDSFSPAHTYRESTGNNDLLDVCFYDPSELKQGLTRGHVHAQVSVAQALWFTGPIENFIDKLNEDTARRHSKREVCLHSTYDVRDRIWIRSDAEEQAALANRWDEHEKEFWDKANAGRLLFKHTPVKSCGGNNFPTEESRHKCLKHEARLARTATIKYLVAMAKLMSELRGSLPNMTDEQIDSVVAERLEREVLEGADPSVKRYGLSEIMPYGILRCDSLRSELEPMIFRSQSENHAH